MNGNKKIITRRTFIGLLGAAGMAAPACLRNRSNPARRPHVVCVLVDQLRKDSSDRWLKQMNVLAARGIVFENMRAVASWTYPSIISMLSGLYAKSSAFGYLSDCMIHRGKKYVRFFKPKTGSLTQKRIFDLARDPREIHSIGDDFGEMEQLLTDMAGFHGLKYSARFDAVGDGLHRKLRILGYLK